MKNKVEIIEQYFWYKNNDERNRFFPNNAYTPLILMVNDEEAVVEELFLDSDCKHKNTLLHFLGECLYEYRDKKIAEDNNYELEHDLYSDIMLVLKAFNEAEDKWTIDIETFVNELLKRA